MTSENGNQVSDKTILEQMNQEYVAAFMNSNVDWYREHLAEDFFCIESNGVIVHKQKFLANIAKVSDVADYKLEQVRCAFTEMRASCKRRGFGLVEIARRA